MSQPEPLFSFMCTTIDSASGNARVNKLEIFSAQNLDEGEMK